MRLFSSITKEYINSIPKIVNENGCWIPLKLKPQKNGYILIGSEYERYYLHRLVMCLYYDIDYYNTLETRHSKGCDRACFFIEHLKPGSASDNEQDKVKYGTNLNSKKEYCLRCKTPFKTSLIKAGWNKGKIQRWCLKCKLERQRRVRRNNA
jgi:hypothetical protein